MVSKFCLLNITNVPSVRFGSPCKMKIIIIIKVIMIIMIITMTITIIIIIYTAELNQV